MHSNLQQKYTVQTIFLYIYHATCAINLSEIKEVEKEQKSDCSFLCHLNLHSLLLYINILKLYTNLTKTIFAVHFATSPRHPQQKHLQASFSASIPLFSSLSIGRGRQDCLMLVLGVPSICALTFYSLDRSECESVACEGPKEMGHSAGCVYYS